MKLALISGNNDYKADAKLKCAVADARAMRDQLSTMGFEVLFAENADKTKMQVLVRALAKQCNDAACKVVTVFYFSGHGAEESGKVFLIPTGRVEPDALADHAYDLDMLQQKSNQIADSTHVMLLDCCRANDTDAIWKSARTKGPTRACPRTACSRASRREWCQQISSSHTHAHPARSQWNLAMAHMDTTHKRCLNSSTRRSRSPSCWAMSRHELRSSVARSRGASRRTMPVERTFA